MTTHVRSNTMKYIPQCRVNTTTLYKF